VSEIRLPLIISLAGHAACLALLLHLLAEPPPAVPEAIAKGGIDVVFEARLPRLERATLPEPPPQPEAPPPPAETPAPPEPPVVATPPTPQPVAPVVAVEPPVTPPEPPPPPRKPIVKKPPKPAQRRQEALEPNQTARPAASAQSPAAPIAPPQTAAAATPVPAPVPSPEASAGYRALLSSWLERHKRYPEAARQRGEEGRAVLRFAVDRDGRVLDYAVIASSGYPDLDQSVEEMMRGATLPPFPAGMPQPRMEISVTIRFSLRR
jgi:periplasmic protein TonB